MKKLKLVIIALPFLLLSACSGGNNPEDVAEKFTKAIYTADFDGAKELCTNDTRQTIDFIAAFASEKKEEMKSANISIDLKNVSIAEDGNTAIVELVVHGSIDLQKGEVEETKDEKVHLVKVDDKWLVEYKLK
jgi:hypothetical protein